MKQACYHYTTGPLSVVSVSSSSPLSSSSFSYSFLLSSLRLPAVFYLFLFLFFSLDVSLFFLSLSISLYLSLSISLPILFLFHHFSSCLIATVQLGGGVSSCWSPAFFCSFFVCLPGVSFSRVVSIPSLLAYLPPLLFF